MRVLLIEKLFLLNIIAEITISINLTKMFHTELCIIDD